MPTSCILQEVLFQGLQRTQRYRLFGDKNSSPWDGSVSAGGAHQSWLVRREPKQGLFAVGLTLYSG